MAYQTNWFDQNIFYWNQYLDRFKGKPVKFLEIGCFEGRATRWLLENILTNLDSSITVIDTFQGSPEFPLFGIDNSKIKSNFEENIELFKEQVTILEGRSDVHLPKLKEKFDFIYIDGSHNCMNVLRDGVYAFDLLKQGGSITFDDYNWDAGMGESERPHEAIQSLITIWGGYYGSWKFWLDQASFTKEVV